MFRIANKVVLVEDIEQQNLVRRYLERCGHNVRKCRFERAATGPGGSGEKYVRDRYAREVGACRSSLGRRASALLIVMVDADTHTVGFRADQLAAALRDAGATERGKDEPVFVLIPKRHVETWIRALQGYPVDEVTDYTQPAPTAGDVKTAAAELYKRTRPDPGCMTPSPPSLAASLPEWRRIPEA